MATVTIRTTLSDNMAVLVRQGGKARRSMSGGAPRISIGGDGRDSIRCTPDCEHLSER